MNTEKLVDFVLNNDFAYVAGAGLMYANDFETKNIIASTIQEDGTMILEVTDLENEGCGCKELQEELNNGCMIYKVYKYNDMPMYIAVY